MTSHTEHIKQLVNGLKPNLLQPCKVEQHDYRTQQHTYNNKSIRLIQFNIERGYHIHSIIQLLQSLIQSEQHCIISLQECDIECERTSWVDTARTIAHSLQLNYIYICEFCEYHSTVRAPRDQGGGTHGNAILTTFDIQSHSVIHHTELYNWSTNPLQLNEPRTGKRATLRITIKHNDMLCNVYNTHFEIFCGIGDRLTVLADLFDDIRSQAKTHNIQCCTILGDLNTQAHGIARLSRKYCRDAYRYLTLGYTEAEWLTQYILNYTNPHLMNNTLLWEYHLEKQLCQRLTNPHLCDPYDVYNDVTLHAYNGLYQGKLDWVLLRYCNVVYKSIHNTDYSVSDHRLLCCDIELSTENTYQPMPLHRQWPGVLTCSTRWYGQIPTVIVGIVLYYILQYIIVTYIL